jgi:hypothetical protein
MGGGGRCCRRSAAELRGVMDGWTTDGRRTDDGRMTDGRRTDGRTDDGRTTDGRTDTTGFEPVTFRNRALMLGSFATTLQRISLNCTIVYGVYKGRGTYVPLKPLRAVLCRGTYVPLKPHYTVLCPDSLVFWCGTFEKSKKVGVGHPRSSTHSKRTAESHCNAL